MTKWMTRIVLGLFATVLTTSTASDAQAQVFYHRHYHSNYNSNYNYRPQHYHDSAGHMVDRYGHHVDGYGRHTGSIGVYDQHSVPSNYAYGTPYTANYGGTYSGAAVAPNRSPDFGLPIFIDCPPAIATPINFSLNGVRHTIQPGQRQTLVNDRSWVVQFDRGGEYGFAEYGLTPGTYEFEATPQGWELYKLTRPQTAVQAQPAPSLPAPNPPPPVAVPRPRDF